MRMEQGARPIPNRLTMFRRMQGYKQKEVAKLLGLQSAWALRQWEQGNSLPNATNLIKLSILYRTYPNELYPEYFNEIKVMLQALEYHFFEAKLNCP